MTVEPTSSPETPPPGFRDVSVPMTDIATRGGLLSLLMLFVPLAFYWLLHGIGAFWDEAFNSGLTLFIALIAAVVLHEVVHAIGWKFAGNLQWRDLSFGIDRRTLSPYCHARVPMTARAYRIGAALPGILTGIVPWLIGLVLANAPLTLLSAVMISAAIGDLIVIWVIRSVPGHLLVKDHPKNAGCYVQIES